MARYRVHLPRSAFATAAEWLHWHRPVGLLVEFEDEWGWRWDLILENGRGFGGWTTPVLRGVAV